MVCACQITGEIASKAELISIVLLATPRIGHSHRFDALQIFIDHAARDLTVPR